MKAKPTYNKQPDSRDQTGKALTSAATNSRSSEIFITTLTLTIHISPDTYWGVEVPRVISSLGETSSGVAYAHRVSVHETCQHMSSCQALKDRQLVRYIVLVPEE